MKSGTAGGSSRKMDSFANVSLHGSLTLFAGYVATPVVLAVAAFYQLLCVRVISTAAAHQVTAVTANRRFVALPETKAEEIRLGFCLVQSTVKHFPKRKYPFKQSLLAHSL